jgi:membrane-bound ClpP family serine protease
MYGTAKLFEVFMAMQSSGNVDIADTVGYKGQIYLVIPPEGVGQVQIETNGSLSTYNARSEDKQEIATGRLIEVVDTMGEVLIVKRI